MPAVAVAAKMERLQFATHLNAAQQQKILLTTKMDEVENLEGSKAKKKNQTYERVPGLSAFPVARVQKILKADKVWGDPPCMKGLSSF
jgi:hypothetical protein